MKRRTWFLVLLGLLAIIGCSRKKPTADLVADLNASHESERIVAVRSLAQRQGEAEQVVPALLKGLKDKSGDVRWSSAIGLGSFAEKAREAIPALQQAALYDRDSRVREAAGVALTRIDPTLPHQSGAPEQR